MTILPIATNEYMSELEVSFCNLYKEEMQLQSEKGSESDVLIGKVSLMIVLMLDIIKINLLN